MKENEPKRKLREEERCRLEVEMVDSFYICLTSVDEETRFENMRNISRIAKILGGEDNGKKNNSK